MYPNAYLSLKDFFTTVKIKITSYMLPVYPLHILQFNLAIM